MPEGVIIGDGYHPLHLPDSGSKNMALNPVIRSVSSRLKTER